MLLQAFEARGKLLVKIHGRGAGLGEPSPGEADAPVEYREFEESQPLVVGASPKRIEVTSHRRVVGDDLAEVVSGPRVPFRGEAPYGSPPGPLRGVGSGPLVRVAEQFLENF